MTEAANNKPERRRARKPKSAQESGVTDESAAAAPRPPTRDSKISKVFALLERDAGATLDEMVEATGWQKHTTRAALTGLKKKGHKIERSKRDEISCYRVKASA